MPVSLRIISYLWILCTETADYGQMLLTLKKFRPSRSFTNEASAVSNEAFKTPETLFALTASSDDHTVISPKVK